MQKGAMKPKKGEKLAALDALGIDAVCDLIVGGASMRDIATKADVSQATLINWLASDAERSARARESRARSAVLWDEKAERVIEESGDPFELSRAKELSHHYRWRAKAIAPAAYGDKMAIGGASDLPPIQQSVTLDPSESYKLLLGGEGKP